MPDTTKVIVIGGVPGVGKTTVINKALEYAKGQGVQYNLYTYGSVMMEIAREKFNVQNRDNLRKLDPKIQRAIQKEAGYKIAARASEICTIVDTHFAIRTRLGSYLQGIPSWVSDALDPKLIVLVETDPDEILKRRANDTSRNRDEESIIKLKEHQEINRTIAATICQKNGALMAIITNRHGQADEAGFELFKILNCL